MSHGLTKTDTMYSVREVPWHGLGSVLDTEPTSIDEALDKSGLGWGVLTGAVQFQSADGGYIIASQHKATIRSDTGDLLGIVGKDYEPLDNRDAFRFLDELIGTSMNFETAGSLFGGKRVWVLARLPEYVEVAGDATGTYVYIANSHDGTMAVTAAVTPIRIVCANTLGFALRRSNTKRTHKVKHTSGLKASLQEAREVMGLAVNYTEQFKAIGDQLALQPMSERKVRTMLESSVYPDDPKQGERGAKNKAEARQAILEIFRGQGLDGDTRGNAPGTAWTAVNAVAEFADFGRRYGITTNQVQRSFEDQIGAGMKARALEYVLAN